MTTQDLFLAAVSGPNTSHAVMAAELAATRGELTRQIALRDAARREADSYRNALERARDRIVCNQSIEALEVVCAALLGKGEA